MYWYDLREIGFSLMLKNENGEKSFILKGHNPRIKPLFLKQGFKTIPFGFKAPVTDENINFIKNLEGAVQIETEPEKIIFGKKNESENERKKKIERILQADNRRDVKERLPRRLRENSEKEYRSFPKHRDDFQGKSTEQSSYIFKRESGSEMGRDERKGRAYELGDEHGDSNNTRRNYERNKKLVSNSGFYKSLEQLKLRKEVTCKQRILENIEAVKLLKEKGSDLTKYSDEDKSVLYLYSGWNGLAKEINKTENNIDIVREYLNDSQFSDLLTQPLYISPFLSYCIWKIMEDSGVNKGGTLLDCTMGFKSLFSICTDKYLKTASFFGFENDPIAFQISQILYPGISVKQGDIETCYLLSKKYDYVFNVSPIHKNIKDCQYTHDYHIFKTLDMLNEGGVAVFLSCPKFLDNKSILYREKISKKFTLLGSIRLPYSYFPGFFEQGQVFDILFFQKKKDVGLKKWIYSQDKFGFFLNSFYIENPDFIAGSIASKDSSNDDVSVIISPEKKQEQLKKVFYALVSRLKYKFDNNAFINRKRFDFPEIEKPIKISNQFYNEIDGSYFIDKDSQIGQYVVIDNEITSCYPTFNESTKDKLAKMVQLKELLLVFLRESELVASEKRMTSIKGELNRLYDLFVRQEGALNSFENRLVFQEDPSFGLLMSLEKYDEKLQSYIKSSFFYSNKNISFDKNVLYSVFDAYDYNTSFLNDLNLKRLSVYSGYKENEVKKKLYVNNLYFLNLEKYGLEHESQFEKGNLNKKLELSKKHSTVNDEYLFNVKYLKKMAGNSLNKKNAYLNIDSPCFNEDFLNNFASQHISDKIKIVKVGGRNILLQNETATHFNEKLKIDVFNFLLSKKPVDLTAYLNLSVDELRLQSTKFMNKILYDFYCFKQNNKNEVDVALDIYLRKYAGFKYCRPIYSHPYQPALNSFYSPTLTQCAEIREMLNGNRFIIDEAKTGKTFTMMVGASELIRLNKANRVIFTVPDNKFDLEYRRFLSCFPDLKVCLVKNIEDIHLLLDMHKKDQLKNYNLFLFTHSAFRYFDCSLEYKKGVARELVYRDEYMASLKENPDIFNLKDIKRVLEINNSFEGFSDLSKLYFDKMDVDALFIDEFYDLVDIDAVGGFQKIFFKTYNVASKHNKDFGVYCSSRYFAKDNVLNLFFIQKIIQPYLLIELGVFSVDLWLSLFVEFQECCIGNAKGFVDYSQFKHEIRNVSDLSNILSQNFSLFKNNYEKIKIPSNNYVQLPDTKKVDCVNFLSRNPYYYAKDNNIEFLANFVLGQMDNQKCTQIIVCENDLRIQEAVKKFFVELGLNVVIILDKKHFDMRPDTIYICSVKSLKKVKNVLKNCFYHLYFDPVLLFDLYSVKNIFIHNQGLQVYLPYGKVSRFLWKKAALNLNKYIHSFNGSISLNGLETQNEVLCSESGSLYNSPIDALNFYQREWDKAMQESSQNYWEWFYNFLLKHKKYLFNVIEELQGFQEKVLKIESDITEVSCDLSEYGYSSSFKSSPDKFSLVVDRIFSSQQLEEINNVYVGKYLIDLYRIVDKFNHVSFLSCEMKDKPFLKRGNINEIANIIKNRDVILGNIEFKITQYKEKINYFNIVIESLKEKLNKGA